MAGKRDDETALVGPGLVSKTHPRIELRGRLDSLRSRVVLLQARAREAGQAQLDAELEEVREVVARIMSCEARDAPLGELVLWGMGEEELRERSWHPQRWYGVGHVLMCADMGIWAAEIDALRTMAREVELCACRAFDGPDGTTRPDMVRVLDRLSSALYVLIYHHLPEGYDETVF